jgi:hypothetical protein
VLGRGGVRERQREIEISVYADRAITFKNIQSRQKTLYQTAPEKRTLFTTIRLAKTFEKN